jgi:subtilisin-like proprotein convertase family protein
MRLSILFLLLVSAFAKAQTIWTPINQEPNQNIEKRNFIPEEYKIYKLNASDLQQEIVSAPMRFSGVTSNIIIAIPNSNGVLNDYIVYETQMMEEQLALKYPSIKTYIGFDIDDPAHFVRFSITPHGIHMIEFRPDAPTVYIDPFTTDHEYYIVYDRSDLPEIKEDFICETDEGLAQQVVNNSENSNLTTLAIDDSNLRTYRIAISCNAQYGNIFAGPATGTDAQKRANIQAQQVITMNRVNGVYERDLAITMIFAANNDVLLYYGDTSLDPYTNEFNSRTQDLIDGNLAGQGFPGIGNAAYDIGHNFNTTGGGNAGCIGCVCTPGQKGSAYTGRANPTGDPFDIDYVAHEIGHQFGGFHTMASSNCRSGSGQTEAEPGSGSTIMAYAGICNPNVQNNSDDYFHYVNIRDISQNVKSGVSSACAVVTSVSATPPLANAGPDFTIPKSTAFILEGSASQLGTQTITYSWEQIDTQNPSSGQGPVADRTVGPMYRSLPFKTEPIRYMPDITEVLNGNLAPDFEKTPSVGRDLNFAFTVRKFDNAIGQNDSDLMRVTVDGASGPFIVTSQSSSATYNIGDNLAITWNVSGTDQGVVGATSVDILLSTDGGFTYPTILATATPNDGAHTVSIPQVTPSNNARIMVRGHNNIFYALNAAPFAINSTNYALTTDSLNKEVCIPNDATFDFNYVTYSGFAELTTLTLSGVPTGATATITPSTVNTDNTPVNVTLSGLAGVAPGSYSLVLNATAPSESKAIDLQLEVLSPNVPDPTLISPVDNAADQTLTTLLEWDAVPGAQEYDVEIATDAAFTIIVGSATVTGTQFAPVITGDTQYYWRVRSRNSCGQSNFGSVYTFRTAPYFCQDFVATQVPVVISSGPPASHLSTLTITDDISIDEVTLTLDISHSWVSDLDVTLTSPSGTTIRIVEDRCGFRNDIFATFSDDGTAISCAFTSPTINGIVLPLDAFTAFTGESALGDWTLDAFDDTQDDGGQINAWTLSICGTRTLSNTSPLVSQLKVYPNPANQKVYVDMGALLFTQASYKLYDLSGKLLLESVMGQNITAIEVNSLAAGLYMLELTVDGKQSVHKLLKE